MKQIKFTIETELLSVNNMYTPYKNRQILKKHARIWKKTVSQEIMIQRGKLPFCFFHVDLMIPGKSRKDVDGCIKALMDCFVKMDRIPDDKMAFKESKEFHMPDHTEITFTEMDFEACLAIKQFSPATVRKYKKLRC